MALRAALREWRMKTTLEMHGPGVLKDLGPYVVMPDNILDRIVDCAHECKFSCVQVTYHKLE